MAVGVGDGSRTAGATALRSDRFVGLGGEVSWPTATRPGDVLRVESEIVEVTPSRSGRERGTVTVRSETRNQRDEIVQRTTVKLLVPRRSKLG